MREPAEPLDFVLQGGEERCAFRQNIRMLIGEKLQLCLQQRQRRTQFMCGVADELPLGVKAAAQALQHFIEGVGEGAKLRQGLFAEPDLGKVACLHLFGLLCKTAQRTQRTTADEIGQHTTEQCDCCCDVPVCCAETRLRPTDNDRQALTGRDKLRVKAGSLFVLDDNRTIILK